MSEAGHARQGEILSSFKVFNILFILGFCIILDFLEYCIKMVFILIETFF